MAPAYFQESSASGAPATCTAVVVYEDAFDRDRVMLLYDRLADQFNQDVEFNFHWWRCKFLMDPDLARQAGEAAKSADMILVSVHAEIPFELKAWIERWLLKRPPATGALVVMPGAPNATGVDQRQEAYFRSVAERAHLDYLPLPGFGSNNGPDHRAGAPGPVPLRPLFRDGNSRRRRSSGFGINE